MVGKIENRVWAHRRARGAERRPERGAHFTLFSQKQRRYAYDSAVYAKMYYFQMLVRYSLN